MASFTKSLNFIKTEDDMEAEEQELEVKIIKKEPINYTYENEISIVTPMATATTAETTTEANDSSLESKVCGVCGVPAKYKHFGAICCDSCKSFFRRSVQTNIWPIFFCIQRGHCDLRTDRRSCKSCRFKRCKRIGMEMSLVMTSEDREALMSRRAERQKQLALDHQRFENNEQLSLLRGLQQQQDSQAARLSDRNNKTGSLECTYDDRDDCSVIEYLSLGDKRRLQSLQKVLTKALSFPNFSQHYIDDGDSSIIENIFYCFCKNMGKFFNSIPEFQALEVRVQKILVKPAIAKAIFILGTHQYDQYMECWPKRLFTADCTFPTVTMSAVEKFIDNRETMYHWKIFMDKYNHFYCEEIITILVLIIAMFDHTDQNLLESSSGILHGKSKYIELLKRYIQQQCAQTSISDSLACLTESLTDVEYLKCCFQNSATKEEVKVECQGRSKHNSNIPKHDRESHHAHYTDPSKATFSKNSCPNIDMSSQNAQSYINNERSVTHGRMTTSPMVLDHDYLRPPEQDNGNKMEHEISYEFPGVIRTKELIIRPLPLENMRHQSENTRTRENTISDQRARVCIDVNHSRNRIGFHEKNTPNTRSEFSTNAMDDEVNLLQEGRDILTPTQQKLLKQLGILNSSAL